MYTALAEWFSCCVFVLALEKRYKKCYTICVLLPFLPVFCVLQYYIGVWPVVVWIPSMVAAMILIYLCIFSCCKVNWKMAMVCFATAFMIAEFSASFEWQIYSYVMGRGHDERVIELIFLVLFYSILFALAYFLEYRYFSGEIRGDISLKEALSSVIMAIAVFLISNISYVYPDTPFSSSLPGGLFYIRTLVDFSGLLILFLQRDRWRELSMQKEMEAVNAILRRQYEQYNLSKENIEIINRKYHDLKHQIAVVRAERNSDKREQYLQEMENDIKMYEAQNKTGNKVLDTILTGKHLYCVQHEINFTCVADGMLLDFMNLMDICTIFGNALDNAIECVEKIGDKSKRLIRTAVYSQSKFLIIRFENYTELELTTKDSLPITTKKDRQYHGYGLKSIRSTVEKYGGSMTVNVKDNWFILRLLIPEEKSL
ncbi:MAG: ATP-binding protein [Blautia obeum]